MNGVLVTGASGFIGTAVCKTLLTAGRQVYGAVRGPGSRKLRISGCEPIAIGEIGPQTKWKQALSRVDTVVHLAARVHMRHDPMIAPLSAYRRVNVQGTLNLARQACAAGVRRFVFLSSIKVNGEESDPGRPFTTVDKPAPVDPYGISKMEAEQGLRRMAAAVPMEVVIIRPPLVYGPGVKANFLALMKLIDTGLPLPLASIDNRRSMIYLGNLVNAVCACMEHPNAAGKTFMVSDGEDLSVADLVRRLARAMGKPARIFPVPQAFLSRLARCPGPCSRLSKLIGSLTVDISPISSDIGWWPPYSVAHGIRETVSAFRKSDQ